MLNLKAHQRNPIKEVHESLLKSKNNFENQINAPNPFPYLDKDTSLEFTSPTRLGKLEIASTLLNRQVNEIQTAQINLSDNFNTSQNLLSPIQNLKFQAITHFQTPSIWLIQLSNYMQMVYLPKTQHWRKTLI